MADVREILDLEPSTSSEITKDVILGLDKQKKRPKSPNLRSPKRPEGMHREVFALLCTDSQDVPPLFPVETNQGYKQSKAQLGMKQVRKWKWNKFTNSARTDGATFQHWQRADDQSKEYPFAKFNKKVDIPSFSDAEYKEHLHSETWSKDETDHLFDLCMRFDLRFIIVHDRWDRSKFPERSVEDLKERYYDIWNILAKLRAPPGQEPKLVYYDAETEQRRKEQLNRLLNRTQEQIDEEQYLISEMQKIEARKREREKKQQDLQKLIMAADSAELRKPEKRSPRKKSPSRQRSRDGSYAETATAGIKFPELKGSGVIVRSSRMKLPASVGQKKVKAIDQMLIDLDLDPCPIPTEDVCRTFNEVRSGMVLLYELKLALQTCDFELQTLRHQYEALNPGRTLVIPSELFSGSPLAGEMSVEKSAVEIIDVVGIPGPSTSYGYV